MYEYIRKIIELEKIRQTESINLIASENYVSNIYQEIKNTILIGKYAEGYPGKRYYAGCKYIDMIENYAINICKKLFKAKYVNVQAHSGSQANQAVYMALCNINEKILGLSLTDGGHLTHGSKINFSGYYYKSIQYKLNTNKYIDYDIIENSVKEHKPKLVIAGSSAYSRIINWYILKKIANKYNAYLLADISHTAGLIATNLYPSPVGVADVVTFTLHKTLRGSRGAIIISNSKQISNLINKALFPGIQGGPFINIIAEKTICLRDALSKKFIVYEKNVLKNAKILSFLLKNYGFDIVSGGTDSHLFLINLTKNKITGVEAQKKLEKANIILNKNTIPNDNMSPNICSGVRIGTAAITTRGFSEKEMYILAKWLYEILLKGINPLKIKNDVINLCKKFPIYND